MAVTREQVAAIYVATFNRAPLSKGLDYWTNSDWSIEKIAKSFFDQQEAKAIYTDDGEAISSEQFVIRIFDNLFNRLPLTSGLDYWSNALDTGAVSQGEMILAVINGATGDDATILANKTQAGLHYADQGGKATDYSLANIDETDESLANALAAIDASLEEDFVLTVNADNLTGSGADDMVTAPVLQNETGSGQLANTFETGDILDGGDGTDVLRADLIATGSISDEAVGGGFNAPAISATTSSIEQVYLRQQSPQGDFSVNGSTIDAEKMADVEQWWSDNSRSGIQIEDIRSATAETTFGMRLTDPRVNFNNYFNALFLEGDVDSGVSSFSFVIAETGNAAAEIANINVIAIRFEYQGQAYSLDSADVAAADTWADLATALQADINADPALAGLTVSHVGGGIFNVIDASAGVFTIDPSGTVVTASTVNETKDATPGLIAPEEGPTITNIVLDGAGNGSQGGTLNIGAMSGLRGVEVFDVDVDRDSHLTVMQSTNLTAPNNGDPNEFLQVVNLNSIGAEGDLQIGSRTANLDGRAALSVDGDGTGVVTDNIGVLPTPDVLSGLYNVVEVNGADFAGNLNVAIALDNNTIGRYLDSATEAVNFTYTAGVGDDIFNIADLSTGGAVSSDKDFAMDVQMSAGDDILIVNVGTVNAANVDGGEGENTIKVAQSHGTTPANTFAEFANFQTYEVEGSGNNVVNNTLHSFDSMSGIENVIIATDGNTAVGGLPTVGDNTQLIKLEADQDVTVSGKNQTIANNGTADQLFGIVTLTNDTGADRTVALENTARLSNTTEGIRTDGVLTVAQLVINENVLPLFPGTSATTDLTVDSGGARNVANAVAAFNGQDVETLELVGTQDLTFNVAEIANQAAATGVTVSTALDIDASELTGELNLAVTGAMIGNWGTATGLTDRIVGTDGDNDTLMLWGAQGNVPVTVTEFETIQFGSANGTMFGDLNMAVTDATGIYDAKNTIATSFVIADDIAGNTALTLNNLGTGVTVEMGDANRDAFGNVVNNQFFDDAITLNSGAVAGTPAAEVTVDYLNNIIGGSVHTLTVGTVGAAAGDDTNGYQTINIDVAHAGNLTAATGVSTGVDARILNLTLTEDSRVLDLSGGADNSGFRDTMAFGVQLPNALNKVDISDYEGDVTFTMQQGDFLTAGTALAQTDVRFVMSEDDANITLSDMDGSLAAATGVQHNSVFEFTAAKTNTDVSEWVITNVVGAGQVGASIDNITRFDVSDLGITSFDQISIDTVDYTGALVAGSLFIRSEAQDDASILTAVNQNTWEIEVVDLLGTMVAGELTEDNFIFA